MTELQKPVSSTARLLSQYARPFIRNAWHVVGWSSEIGEGLLTRRILGEPLVFYRTEAGEAVALVDVCPHKLAPMHLGRRIGDNLQCGYHGLEFDQRGGCVRNPQGNGQIPPHARLKSYPLVERYGAVWIWMGDPALADSAKIPDFSHMDDPERKTMAGHHMVQGNYMLMVENLMDLGHVMFLHAQSAGAGGIVMTENKMGVDGETVFDSRLYGDVPKPAAFAPYYPEGARVDFWTDIRWDAPSLIRNHAGSSPAGTGRNGPRVDQFGSHFLTPETQDTTHYFYAHSRNYGIDDPACDDFYRKWQRTALKEEDSMVAEAIQRHIPEAEALGIEMVVLSTDRSGIRVNQILDRMAAAEAEDA